MKYKVVGVLDLIFALPAFLYELAFLFVVYPKISVLQAEFNTIPSVSTYVALAAGILTAIFAGVLIFIGIKLLRKPSDNLFLIGIIGIFGIVTLIGISSVVTSMGMLTSIYNVNNEL